MGAASLRHGRGECATPVPRELVRNAQPSPAELLTLWPAELRLRLVLLVRVDESGGVEVSARLREHDFEPSAPNLARQVRRVRGDVPVVVHTPGARPVVVPWAWFE